MARKAYLKISTHSVYCVFELGICEEVWIADITFQAQKTFLSWFSHLKRVKLILLLLIEAQQTLMYCENASDFIEVQAQMVDIDV